jgi:hypothetical protein
MTTPSGQISLDDVNIELDLSPGSQINMNAANVRGLAEVPTGAIAMSNLQGKSNASYVSASGGTVTQSGSYKIHTFNGNGTFTVNAGGNEAGSDTVDYLVVAGGGSGGNVLGAGGGAGGRRIDFPNPGSGGLAVNVQGYPITVGGGGAGSNAFLGPMRSSNNGNPSNFSNITSTAGGGGGIVQGPGSDGKNGAPGGSGGGAGNGGPGGGTPGQGNAGGSSQAGGGGGSSQAGAAGQHPSPSGANGGNGTASNITGSPVTLCGGGGAFCTNNGGTGGSGGSGGGGGGARGQNPAQGQNAQSNTGGGGGGGMNAPVNNVRSGNGGSGTVIISYRFQA